MTKKELIKLYQKCIFQINKIKKWLADNDWKVNKIVVGEWQRDDVRWIDYLNERENKRNLMDELIEQANALLEQIKSLQVVENED